MAKVSGTSVIEAKNVSYFYGNKSDSGNNGLNKINFSIEENQVIGVIGHTGSGKSTLAQLLNGLIKPTEGQIFLKGKKGGTRGKKYCSCFFSFWVLKSW